MFRMKLKLDKHESIFKHKYAPQRAFSNTTRPNEPLRTPQTSRMRCNYLIQHTLHALLVQRLAPSVLQHFQHAYTTQLHTLSLLTNDVVCMQCLTTVYTTR